MYSNNPSGNKKIYSQFVSSIESEEIEVPILASLVEQCRSLEVSQKEKVQQNWSERIFSELEPIAADNPYLPDITGEEVSALEAIAWTRGSRGVDCRPKIFNGISKSWMLCDTGSMVTAVKRGPDDKLDESRYLQAVNGSKIKCFGKKEIQIRLGRKTYTIEAVIADIKQDILGWDFLAKYRLNWKWAQFGDLYLVDSKARIKAPVKFVALPASQQMALLGELPAENSSGAEVQNFVTEFEVASMKLLDKEKEPEKPIKIQPKYQKLLDEFPEVLTPTLGYPVEI